MPRKAQKKPVKEPKLKLSRADFEGAVRAFLQTPARKGNELEAEIVREREGLCLSLELTVSNYLRYFNRCENLSGSLIRGVGIDFAPSDKLIGVCVYFDEKNSRLSDGVNVFLGFSNPSHIRAQEILLIITNLLKAKVGSFVTIPKNTIFKTKRTGHGKINGT
ncbi:MAG: hypothetical protein ABSH11_10010 [Verrucomicrobiota bacterium]